MELWRIKMPSKCKCKCGNTHEKEIDRPNLVSKPNWTALVTYVEKELQDAIKSGYMHTDIPHYIYEDTMRTIYGEDFFVWFNKSGLGAR